MIRYDKNFNKEIKRVINNYNAKIRRLEKKGIDTPDKIYKKDIDRIKENANSRKELREVLKGLQLFNKRGAELKKEGTNFTNYEYDYIKKLQREATRNINRQLSFFEKNKPTIIGEEQTLTFAEMKDERYMNLLAKKSLVNKNINLLKKEEVKDYIRKLERNKHMLDFEKWQDRYIEIFSKTLETFEIDKRSHDLIIERLSQIDAKKFDKLIRKEQMFRGILDYYAMIKDLDNFMQISNDVETTVNSIVSNLDEILEDYE